MRPMVRRQRTVSQKPSMQSNRSAPVASRVRQTFLPILSVLSDEGKLFMAAVSQTLQRQFIGHGKPLSRERFRGRALVLWLP